MTSIADLPLEIMDKIMISKQELEEEDQWRSYSKMIKQIYQNTVVAQLSYLPPTNYEKHYGVFWASISAQERLYWATNKGNLMNEIDGFYDHENDPPQYTWCMGDDY